MTDNRSRILTEFSQAQTLGIKDLFLIPAEPSNSGIWRMPYIVFILSGNVKASFLHNREYKQIICNPGTFFYCSNNGMLEFNNSGELGTSRRISMIYYGKYIRAISTSYFPDNTIPEHNTYYNSDIACPDIIQALLETLDALAARNGEYPKAAMPLLKALMILSVETMEAIKPEKSHIAEALWQKINHFVKVHCCEDICRGTVADHFSVSAGYISKQFKTFGHQDFTSYLTDLRLGQAANLLRETSLSLDEISMCCGFNYTSYFIRCFKKSYKMTPSAFRKMNLYNLER